MSLPSTSPFGGWRNRQTARFDLIPGEALEAVAEAFAEGEDRYGRLPDDPYYPNWVGLDLSSDQSPLSHALAHLAAVQAGTDASEDHLASAAANLCMLLWFRDSPLSLVQGLTWPDVIRVYYKKRQEHLEETPDDLVLDDLQPEPEPNILDRLLSKISG